MNFELEQLLQQQQQQQRSRPMTLPLGLTGSLQRNNGVGAGLRRPNRLSRDKAVDEGSIDILEHLIAIILQENAAYLEKLLQNEEVIEVLDYQDNKGFTPLHISADKYDVECCRLLLQAGANPNIVDNFGRTALHWVVSGGCHCETCNTKRSNCTKLLIQARTNIEAQDQNGDTPLFYAANNMLTKSAVVLLENGAEISKTNLKGVNLGQLLVQKVPFVMSQLLDSCISYDEEDNSELKIDFSVLLDSSVRHDMNASIEGGFDVSKTRSTGAMSRNTKKPKIGRETELLSCMLKAFPIGRELLLMHPVTETFLHLKWLYVRKWFWFIRIFYCIVTLLYTFFIFNFYINQCPYHENNDGSLRSSDLISRPLYSCQQKPLELTLNMYIMLGGICGSLFCILMNHLNAICFDTSTYFHSFGLNNLGWWILLLSCSLTLLPPIGVISLNYWIYLLAAFSIFWVWTMHLAHLNRIPYLGVYVEMFGKALQKMLIIGCIYSSLFIAFVLGFCILFPQNAMFQEIPSAAVKVFLMMVGDREYGSIFTYSNGTNTDDSAGEERLLHPDYNLSSHFFYIAFIIMFGILMINLLVGLAVSDIQELRKGAELLQVERQIVELARLETFLSQSWFCFSNCCNQFFLSVMSVEARNGRYFNFSPTDPTDHSLPPKLQAKFIPYLPTRSCLKKINLTTHKARVLQKHLSSESQLLLQAQQPTSTRPFYVNDNLDSILLDLKIRLEGLTRRTTSAPILNNSVLASSSRLGP